MTEYATEYDRELIARAAETGESLDALFSAASRAEEPESSRAMSKTDRDICSQE